MAVNKIIGIDPGTVNLGYCVINASDGTILDQATVSIMIDKAVMGAHAKVAVGVVNALREPIASSDFVVAEQQMKVKMGVVFGAALAAAGTKPVAGVAPCSVKRHFGIPLTGNYARNKRLAIEKVAALGVKGATSHVADAYLCALYAAEVILKTKPYSQHERQSPVPRSNRRVRGPGVLPLQTSDVRVPCPATSSSAAPAQQQCTTISHGTTFFGP